MLRATRLGGGYNCDMTLVQGTPDQQSKAVSENVFMQILPDSLALIAPADGVAYVRGATDVPLSESTIGDFLRDTAERFPERQAVVFREQGVRWTWKEFDERVDRFSAGLKSLGIAKGDRVGSWSPNRFEWLLTQFATARIGAVLVNINPAYRVSELEYALRKVRCKALVTAEQFKTSKYISMLLDIAPELTSQQAGDLHCARLPELRTVISVGDPAIRGVMPFSAVMEKGEAILRDVEQTTIVLSAHDPINIQFTSGTTGRPKGATLTHRNIVNNGRFVAMAMKLSEADSLCIPVPLYHCFGMVLAVLACVSVGAKMVFPGEGFDARTTLASIAEEGCTALHGVPAMFEELLTLPRPANWSCPNLRTGIVAGAPVPKPLMERMLAELNMREFTSSYGLTEASPTCFNARTDDTITTRLTTVGKLLPHLHAKIIDREGKTVKVGERGELCISGYSLCKGYWKNKRKTDEAMVRDERGVLWLKTGDEAVFNEEGYCTITGRFKDIIIRGEWHCLPGMEKWK